MSSDEMPDVRRDSDRDRQSRVQIDNIEIFEQNVKQERRQTQLSARKKKKKRRSGQYEYINARQEATPIQSAHNSQVKLVQSQNFNRGNGDFDQLFVENAGNAPNFDENQQYNELFTELK